MPAALYMITDTAFRTVLTFCFDDCLYLVSKAICSLLLVHSVFVIFPTRFCLIRVEELVTIMNPVDGV